MSRITTEQLIALADVAVAVNGLRHALPADWNLDALKEEVVRITGALMTDSMDGEEDGDDAGSGVAKPQTVAAVPKTKRVKAATKKAPAVPKSPASAPSGDKPASVMRVCPDCGASYLRTGNSQKRCKACAETKTREAQAAWKKDRQEGGPEKGSPAGRLERIKAIDKKLDTIPERGAE